MAVGAVPFEEEDPNAVAGPLPANGPGAPAPTVMTPLGPLPADTPGLPPPAVTPPSVPPPAALPDAPTGLPAGAAPAPPIETQQPAALPPRPTRPPLTGDPSKDIQSSLAYERQLDDWHSQALGAATSQQNQIAATAAQKDLALAQDEQKRRDAMRIQQEQERIARQASIDDAVKERAAANGNIENATWRGDQSTGSKIASVIAMALSGVGQGLSAAGGHPAENMAQKVIEERTAREYDIAKNRLASANETVLQARYGYKDTLDNQRAALNDLDADFSAKHKLIAEEAAAQMKAKGVAPEMIASSELVNGNLQKAQQYEDNIHAREIEAGRKNELADSTIALNKEKGAAQSALADYRERRNANAGRGGAGGGTSKAGAKAEKDELKDIENAAKPHSAVVLGSSRSPGMASGYDAAVAVSNELKSALRSGDPDTMKIAVLHAQEQSTRFLTGAAGTEATYAMQHALSGSSDDLTARLGHLLGTPTESKAYVSRLAQNMDAIAKQRKEMLEAERTKVQTRLDSIATSDAGKKRAAGIIDSLFGKGGGGESGATRKTQTMGGATYEFGDDGNWHKAK